jgi:hypothetical protein
VTGTVLTEPEQPERHSDEPAVVDEPAATPSVVERVRRHLPRERVARLVELLALYPVFAMLVEVARAGRLQYIDYWYLLTRFLNPDGTIAGIGPGNLQSNDHILGVPALVYWINIKLFAGDNRTLGVFVVGTAVVTVLVLRAALPKTLPPLLRAGIVVTASALLFSPHGLWNFTRAMSGTAWLTANMIVVIALLLGTKGKWWPAWATGLVGAVTYGSAFAVWPVLALIAFLRRDPWWQRILPIVVGVLIYGWWMLSQPPNPLPGSPTDDLGSLLYNLLIVVGHLWTAETSGVAVFAGGVILAGYAALASSHTAREPQFRFWWAVAVFGFLGSGMIAASRVDYGIESGMESRYTSFSVLMSVPLFVLAAAVLHRRFANREVAITTTLLVAGLLGFTLGAPSAVTERKLVQEHFLEAVAIRGGFSDSFRRLPDAEDLLPRLQALGHYPFTDDFTLGCGGPELGTKLDVSRMVPLEVAAGNRKPDHATGEVERVVPRRPAPTFHGLPVPVLYGWAADPNDPVRCVVVVDGTGVITGGGVSGIVRPDVAFEFAQITPNAGFVVIGPVATDSRVVVIHDSGALHWLPPRVNVQDPVPPPPAP